MYEEGMSVDKLIVRSSIQVFGADPNHAKPEYFGSGCLVRYLDRTFFLSVFHVVNHEHTTFLETNLPSSEGTTPIAPIGGLFSFDALKVNAGMDMKDFEELITNKSETLDITFAEIKHPIELLQPEMDFGAFKVEAGPKVCLMLDNIAEPTKDKLYGFYGKIRPEYIGNYLKMTPTLKHSLKFHATNGYFHKFLAPEIITDADDYRGTSGAPILDEDGYLVALACKVMVGTKLVFGFSIQECVKLLKRTLDVKML